MHNELCERLGIECIEAVERVQLVGPAGPRQQKVGQCRVPGQGRPVQVGADDPARVGTLGSVPVAHAGDDPGQRRNVRTELRHALVILESAEPGHAQGGVDLGEDLTDPPPRPAAALDVENLEARQRPPVCVTELGAHQLVARADGEDGRAPVGRRSQAPVGPEPCSGMKTRSWRSPPPST